MRQTLSRRLSGCLLVILLLLTCVSCKKVEACTNSDYLDLLCEKAGLSHEEDETAALLDWGIITEEEREVLEDKCVSFY